MSMIYEEEGFAIRGAVFEVSKTLGTGFAEEVYQEALEMELAERGIPFEAQKELLLSYKGRPLKKTSPSVGMVMRLMMRIRVVLPAPFGPSRPKI